MSSHASYFLAMTTQGTLKMATKKEKLPSYSPTRNGSSAHNGNAGDKKLL